MNNKEYLKKYGIRTTGNIDEDNKLINEFFDVESTEKVEAYVRVNGKMKRFNISPVNYHTAFVEEIWKTLSVQERLKVLKWHQSQYLTKKGYKANIPPFEFVSKQNFENVSYSAIAKTDGNLVLSLDFVEKCKGVDALVILTHECEHFLDFENFDVLYTKYIGKYIKHTTSNLGLGKLIMELPVEGKIKNLQTGEYEFVTNQMRNEFLLMKNHLATFSKKSGTPEKKKLVTSEKSYDNYLEQLFYYTSPLEYRAQHKSIAYATSIFMGMKKEAPVTEFDMDLLQKQNQSLKKLDGKIREVQKLYNCSYYNALNMELVTQFNQNLYGKMHDRYICKDVVSQRDEKRENAWERKMGYYGDYKPYESREVR